MAAPDIAERGRVQRMLAGVWDARPAPALVAAGCALALAAAGGWWLGGASRAPAPAVAPNSVAAVGEVQFELEAGWAPATAPVEGAEAFAPVSGLPARALLVSGPAVDASLIPAALRAELPDRLPAPRATELAGLAAWSYGPLRERGRLIELTVAPTTGGMLAVACMAPPSAWSGALGCADGVHAIATDARALAPAPDLAFRQAAGPALETLDARRVAGRARLSGARRPSAAAALARAHREAATALAPFAVPGAPTDTVAALRQAARGYEALAATGRERRFVSRGERARFLAALRAVTRGDAALAAALAELR